jgi:hypothetical protein
VTLKRSYSSLNLLQGRLSGVSESIGFFKYFFSSRKYLTVELPYYSYLRGNVFISDLRDNYKEEVPYAFDLSTLIFLLYDDLMNQIKRGVADNKQIAQYLIAGKNKYFPKKTVEKRVLKPLTKHVFEYQTIEEEDDDEAPNEEKTAYLTIRMRESEILRGEVLLHDLDSYFSGEEITIEQVIAIVYLDFIENVRNNGNSLKVQKSILSHLKRF